MTSTPFHVYYRGLRVAEAPSMRAAKRAIDTMIRDLYPRGRSQGFRDRYSIIIGGVR